MYVIETSRLLHSVIMILELKLKCLLKIRSSTFERCKNLIAFKIYITYLIHIYACKCKYLHFINTIISHVTLILTFIHNDRKRIKIKITICFKCVVLKNVAPSFLILKGYFRGFCKTTFYRVVSYIH